MARRTGSRDNVPGAPVALTEDQRMDQALAERKEALRKQKADEHARAVRGEKDHGIVTWQSIREYAYGRHSEYGGQFGKRFTVYDDDGTITATTDDDDPIF